MHGSYTHRITCNLYPTQYYTLERAAERAQSRLAPFVRDAALAYTQQKIVLPQGLEEELRNIYQEIHRAGTGLHEIAGRASTLQRLTHSDLKHAGQLVTALDRQLVVLGTTLDSLSHVHQVHGS